MSLTRITVPVHHLRCAGSERYTVERALQAIPGVVEVYVNPVTELAYITYDPTARQRGRSSPPPGTAPGSAEDAKRPRKKSGDA